MTLGRNLIFACGIGLSTLMFGAAHDTPNLPITEIVRRSVAVNTSDWQAQPQYGYREFDLKSKVDAGGTVHPQQSKSYEVMMIDGSPYHRLIAINNEPLTPALAAQEQFKLQREMLTRQHETAEERTARIAKYQNNRAEEHTLMQQMTEAFQFKLVGEETQEGTECYVLDAYPRADYQPPLERAKVLKGMRGRLWIDKTDYHWVKVQAEVISPVEFGLFVAQVKPGTRFELSQAPVGNVWLPKSFTESVNASVLGLYGYRTKEEEHFSAYHSNQLSASTRTVAP
jgi:hypothetical protein